MATKTTTKTYKGGESMPAVGTPAKAAQGSSNPVVKPAYNANTGATTGKPSAEYDTYLKSLNKKGSTNYVNTPDDLEYTGNDKMIGTLDPNEVNSTVMNPSVPSANLTQTPQLTPQGNIMTPTNKSGVTTPTANISQGTPLADKYTQGLNAIKGTGLPAPTSGGLASASIQQAMKGVSQDPAQANVVGQIMETDSNFDSILTGYDDFFSPPKQKKSLVQEYQSMLKASGVESINEDLIDAKRIIEGTEDDIRLEVQKSGGFATDSQVQALANSRNKSLIKNYNYLLESRDNAMTQLNTMMNLTVQDRDAAQAEFDRKLNYTIKIQEYKDKAVSNAREGFNNYIKASGADNFLASMGGDSASIARAEKVLGYPPGGLENAAKVATEQRATDLRRENLENQNIQSQIDSRNQATLDSQANTTKTVDGKPQTLPQATANGYADRMRQAEKDLGSLGGSFTGKFAYGNILPNQLQSSERQRYEQAQKNFINAVLRRESGATIIPSEFANARQQYFPQAGDKPETVAQKSANRNTVINNFYREANIPRPVSPGDIVENGGKRYKVDSDGETLIEI